MKKLIKLFSLIGVFTLCLGMTLLTTNKTNVKAQSDLWAYVYLPIPSGFYVYDYDYPNEWRLFYLYNALDNGGKYYQSYFNFGSDPSLPIEIVVQTSMKQLIESTPRLIEENISIKTTILHNLTVNASIGLTATDFWVYDVSTWFKEKPIENSLNYDLYYIQHTYHSSDLKIPISSNYFSDLLDLAETQINQFGIDISNAVIDNADIVDSDYIYNYGWNVGYGVGYDKGSDDGYELGYDEAKETYGKNVSGEWLTAEQYGNIRYEDGRQDVHSPTPVEYFLYEFNNWIVPAIAVAVFGGGLFMLFSRKREV